MKERMTMAQCEALVATYEREGWPQRTPWCEHCENDLADCICPDLESRVTNIAMQRCQRCGLTSYRCRCVQPAPVLALPSGA